MRARRIGALALAAMLATGLAACSDDGGDDDAVGLEDVDGSGSASGTDDTAADDTTDTTDDSDDSDTDTDADVPFDLGSEECQELFEGLSGLGALGGGDDVDFGDFATLFENLADNAPAIADDLRTMAGAYEAFDEALGGASLSDPEIFSSPEFLAASEAFSSEEVSAASERVSEFMEEACGTG